MYKGTQFLRTGAAIMMVVVLQFCMGTHCRHVARDAVAPPRTGGYVVVGCC